MGGLVSASNVLSLARSLSLAHSLSLARSLSLTSHLVLSLKYIQCITTRERFLLIIYACMIKCQYEFDSEQSSYSNA